MPPRSAVVWWPLWITLGILTGTAVLFWAGGIFLGFPQSWELIAGILTPANLTYPALAWALSVVGYLVIPAVIGLLAATGAELIVRTRLRPAGDVREELEEQAAKEAKSLGTDSSSSSEPPPAGAS